MDPGCRANARTPAASPRVSRWTGVMKGAAATMPPAEKKGHLARMFGAYAQVCKTVLGTSRYAARG
jgi:hypothetical protein